MDKKLEVKNLRISFRTDAGKVQAVRDISFDLMKGETLSIVGESGSGKSVTSRAIIGILAGNAIVEGGDIIYDGKDLLKISEEDFHKIRGDKIAMIFQDPMSSLNPIMKVGKQLTEAMILKSAASRRSARKNFNGKLALLNKNIDAMTGEAQKAHNKEQCDTFDKFSVISSNLERKYNDIFRHVVELEVDIIDFIFLVQKKQKVDAKKTILKFVKEVDKTIHPDLVVVTQSLTELLEQLKQDASLSKANVVPDGCLQRLQQLSTIMHQASQRPKPNYFTLGFYMMKNPTANVDDMPVEQLTEMTRRYLDDNFMTEFIKLAELGMQHSHDTSINLKHKVLDLSEQALLVFQSDYTKKQARDTAKPLVQAVEAAIDRLVVAKSASMYTFKDSINDLIKKYFSAVKRNPKEQARYDRQSAKKQKLEQKGKSVDWKVTPPLLLDLDIIKNEIYTAVLRLRDTVKHDIENKDNFNANDEVIRLIDYMKEQESAFVQTISRKMAKMTAMNLLEEVGIPEPAIRYNQYPFEFSGGMRQRIVIAIALAANPDILICDEPTTALDVTIQAQILELINKIKQERNLSVIFITHDLGVVANMADRIAVMYAGKIVEIGTADDIFYDPRHPYTWALLSSMPDLETTEKLEAIPGTPPNMIYPPVGDAFAARNKYALAIDFEQEPELFEVSETHRAATWLLHPDAPKVDPPKIVTDRIARMQGGVDNG